MLPTRKRASRGRFSAISAASNSNRSASSAKVCISLPRRRLSAGSFPSATEASIFLAAARACSTVTVPNRPIVTSRSGAPRPPQPDRYRMTKVLVPEGSTRSPNPDNSLSQTVVRRALGATPFTLRVVKRWATRLFDKHKSGPHRVRTKKETQRTPRNAFAQAVLKFQRFGSLWE
jgi:hypothetical protein